METIFTAILVVSLLAVFAMDARSKNHEFAKHK